MLVPQCSQMFIIVYYKLFLHINVTEHFYINNNEETLLFVNDSCDNWAFTSQNKENTWEIMKKNIL